MLFAFAMEQVEAKQNELTQSEETNLSHEAEAQVWTGRTLEAAAPGGCSVGWAATLAQWDGYAGCITA